MGDPKKRAEITAGLAQKTIGKNDGRDFLDAYNVVAKTRLEYQSNLIKQGKTSDNYLPHPMPSGLDRRHLRGAFVVTKTMQAALMHKAEVFWANWLCRYERNK
ncbi:MAG: signal-transduction protein with cAMP-binding, CBS, and nucleotidyltransferase domain [Candidatus Azotimanducaceae bacterium]